ncbi:hypothetical protein PROH_09035 [Prochlorothrix hollandica PCC 9006 = CALU 1027]|uniref:Uncharacterized protein n=1 Tax=Prochlorothrix hollandica PCC 9006 = CALU 1027 TaxID=317619 RepID=A0A0M2PZX3_PROHO|nr:hypothetical protein PROH_09035 [Prochlorothrix hollandica PCC 9006 = CALU 1027]
MLPERLRQRDQAQGWPITAGVQIHDNGVCFPDKRANCSLASLPLSWGISAVDRGHLLVLASP